MSPEENARQKIEATLAGSGWLVQGMNMNHRTAAKIELVGPSMGVRLEWSGFDGDDCFGEFNITVAAGGVGRKFEFGPCAIWGLRKMSKFFADASISEVGLGFRNPDIRYCDIHRADDIFRLAIRFEGSAVHEEFEIHNPAINDDGEFLREY